MKRLLVAGALLFLTTTRAEADPITKPIRYTWIATSCSTWNTAAAAIILANGDPHVIALPTGVEERPWLILKRVEEGSIYVPEDEPFTCELFETVTDASARFAAMDSCHAPVILNLPDGRMVITSLQKCGSKRRAVR